MSTLLRRDPKAIFPDLMDWFEEPFLTLRPYLGQPIRVEEHVPADLDEEAVTASYRDGILSVEVGLKPEKKVSAKKIEVATPK